MTPPPLIPAVAASTTYAKYLLANLPEVTGTTALTKSESTAKSANLTGATPTAPTTYTPFYSAAVYPNNKTFSAATNSTGAVSPTVI